MSTPDRGCRCGRPTTARRSRRASCHGCRRGTTWEEILRVVAKRARGKTINDNELLSEFEIQRREGRRELTDPAWTTDAPDRREAVERKRRFIYRCFCYCYRNRTEGNNYETLDMLFRSDRAVGHHGRTSTTVGTICQQDSARLPYYVQKCWISWDLDELRRTSLPLLCKILDSLFSHYDLGVVVVPYDENSLQ